MLDTNVWIQFIFWLNSEGKETAEINSNLPQFTTIYQFDGISLWVP